jgi:uncharacterized protein (TIGR03435 family)
VLHGHFSVTSDPVGDLIHTAFGVENFQFVDGPDWVVRERWDIVATAEHAATPAGVRAILRSLLEHRFQLVARTAMREMRVYTLVRARDDGRLGPAIHASTVDCAALDEARGEQGGSALCGYGNGPSGEMVGGGRTIAQLARVLGGFVGRRVVNQTGLTGTFDFSLHWAPDTQGPGPSIVTAIQKQLGLKLESCIMAIEVLVRFYRPTGRQLT